MRWKVMEEGRSKERVTLSYILRDGAPQGTGFDDYRWNGMIQQYTL